MLISFIVKSHFRFSESDLRCLTYHSPSRRMSPSHPGQKIPHQERTNVWRPYHSYVAYSNREHELGFEYRGKAACRAIKVIAP